MRAKVLKAGTIAAIFAKPWLPTPVDLTTPGTGVTQEERDYILRAARAVYNVPPAKVIDLDAYRQRVGRHAG